MNLEEYQHKKVRVTLTDGAVFTGLVINYTSALDNEPDPESITLDTGESFVTEFLITEIAIVEIIK